MACGCNSKKSTGSSANTKPAATQSTNKQTQKLPLVSIDKKALSQTLAKKISKRQ